MIVEWVDEGLMIVLENDEEIERMIDALSHYDKFGMVIEIEEVYQQK